MSFLQLQQLLMKNAISRTLKDPTLATAEVIPTSTMDVPAQEPIVPAEDLINESLRHRPELVESRIDLNSRELSNKAVRSLLLPTLDLFAYYGGSGLGGAQNSASLCADQNPQQFGCAPTPVSSTGFVMSVVIRSIPAISRPITRAALLAISMIE